MCEDNDYDNNYDNGFKTVFGFEFESDLPLNDDAIFILGTLQRKGCVYVETEDQSAIAIEQLRYAATEGYFDVISSPDNYRHWIIISKHFEVILMNPYEED